FGKSLDETGGTGSQHNIASQSQVGTGTGCHPVDSANDRLVQFADLPYQRVVILLNGFTQVWCGMAVCRVSLGQILAGTKPPAGTCQQNSPHSRVFCRLCEACP